MSPWISPNYFRMPISFFPEHIIQQYDLRTKVRNGFIYLEIREKFIAYPKQACLKINILKRNWPPRILQGPPHARSLETHLLPHPIWPCCRQFGCQLCCKRSCRPPHTYPQERIYHQQILGRNPVLWHFTLELFQPQMGQFT